MCLKFKNHLPILRKDFLLYFIINLELVWNMNWNSSPISCLSIWRFNCCSTVIKEPAMQYSTAFTINQASVYEWFFKGSVYTHWLACLALCQECAVLWVLETCGASPSTSVPLQACLEDIIVYVFSKNILECIFQCAPGKTYKEFWH